jgi:predicted transcriptional regulator
MCTTGDTGGGGGDCVLHAEATVLFRKYPIDDFCVVDMNNEPVGLIDAQDIVTVKVAG